MDGWICENCGKQMVPECDDERLQARWRCLDCQITERDSAWTDFEYGDDRRPLHTQDVIECTAWDLVGRFSDPLDYGFRIYVGGRSYYEGAHVTRNQTVCLHRLEPTTEKGIHVVRRYVGHDTPVVLRREIDALHNTEYEGTGE